MSFSFFISSCLSGSHLTITTETSKKTCQTTNQLKLIAKIITWCPSPCTLNAKQHNKHEVKGQRLDMTEHFSLQKNGPLLQNYQKLAIFGGPTKTDTA